MWLHTFVDSCKGNWTRQQWENTTKTLASATWQVCICPDVHNWFINDVYSDESRTTNRYTNLLFTWLLIPAMIAVHNYSMIHWKPLQRRQIYCSFFSLGATWCATRVNLQMSDVLNISMWGNMKNFCCDSHSINSFIAPSQWKARILCTKKINSTSQDVSWTQKLMHRSIPSWSVCEQLCYWHIDNDPNSHVQMKDCGWVSETAALRCKICFMMQVPDQRIFLAKYLQ